jgi:hypothetical protein
LVTWPSVGAHLADLSGQLGPVQSEDRMHGIRGLHVNWTLPRKIRRDSDATGYVPGPDEIVTSIHSALSWNKFHGPIDMSTDDDGAAWLEHSGLADLYRTIEVGPLQSIDPGIIDPLVYPTLGKVVALESATSPVAFLDTDFYLMRPAVGLESAGFVFTHFETVDNFVYPPAMLVPDANGAIDAAWDFTLPAANTSFAFFGSNHHRNAFVEKAMSYSRCNNLESDLYPWVRPCFAEQRISVFEASRLGVYYRPLVEAVWSPSQRRWAGRVVRDLYHHTWSDKDRILTDPGFARFFIDLQVAELLRQFPSARSRVLKLKDLGLLDFSPEATSAHGL